MASKRAAASAGALTLQIISYVLLLGVSAFLITWGILNIAKTCEVPLAKVAIGTGALTAAITFALIASEWIATRLGAPKKSDESKPTASTVVVITLWIIAILGTVATWGYLGYCALSMYIKHRKFPNVNSCDATLLDPIFYVTAVVLTVGFLFLVAKAIELAIACCYRKPSDPAHDIFGLSADSTFKRSGAAAEESQPLAADHVA